MNKLLVHVLHVLHCFKENNTIFSGKYCVGQITVWASARFHEGHNFIVWF